MEKNPAVDAIRQALIARYPLIAVVSYEEERVEQTLRQMARTTFARPAGFYTWSVTEGLAGADGVVPDTTDPVAALTAASARGEAALYVFFDLHVHFQRPDVRRKLRDVRRALDGSPRYLFLVGPEPELPRELRRDVTVIDFPLPAPDELGRIVERHLRGLRAPLELDADARGQVVTALQGLTANEAQHALNVAFFRRDGFDAEVVRALHRQKEQLARKGGVLEYIPHRWTVDDVGGLDVLKDWLGKRRRLFEEDGIPEGMVPRGFLVMGIPGCGKSLSVKAVATQWNLPLFRLDMGQVFSGVHGSPEESFARALGMMESVAPAILWIDEIENGISAVAGGLDGDAKGRIFATFLTWMQEKPAKVFVAATANRIDLLPAELLRKGRFDQVFFIDLPSEQERADIFAVHFRQRGVDPAGFDLVTLAKATKNWNGAEIEQCVVSAMVEAHAKVMALGEHELFVQIGKIVPLSTTMAEQIKAIKSWAHNRALRASPEVR